MDTVTRFVLLFCAIAPIFATPAHACEKYPANSIRKVLVEKSITVAPVVFRSYATATRAIIREVATSRSLSIDEILTESIAVAKARYPSVALEKYQETALRFILSGEPGMKMPAKEAAVVTLLIEEARVQLLAEVLGLAGFGDTSEDNRGINSSTESEQFSALGGASKQDYNTMLEEAAYARKVWGKKQQFTTETKILMKPLVEEMMTGLEHLKSKDSSRTAATAIIEDLITTGQTTWNREMLFGRSLRSNGYCALNY